MISTANYIARKFGIKSGLPGFIGLKLCPELVFVQPNLDKYKAVSQCLGDLLKKFDSGLDIPSPDEFVLDVTEFLQKLGLDHDLGKIYIGSRI